MVRNRTAALCSSAPESSSGSKPSMRAASDRYGGRFSCALQTDQVLDHLQCRHLRALEQVLSQQQRAVQVTESEHERSVDVRKDSPARR